MTAVSVVIPVHNRPDLLRDAIGSTLKQTYTDFEVIVVDDASTEDIHEVVRGFNDGRLRYVRQERQGGASAARNKGVAEARGTWIAFLDSDDEWRPQKLAQSIQELDRLGAGALVTAFDLQIRRGGPLETRSVPKKVRLRDLAWGCGLSPGSTLVVRRSDFETVGGFDPELRRLEDWDWLIRYLLRFKVIVGHQKPLTLVRSYSIPSLESVQASTQEIRRRYGTMYRKRNFIYYLWLRSSIELIIAACAFHEKRRRLAMRSIANAWLFWPFRNLRFYMTITQALLGRRSRRSKVQA